MPLRVYVRRHAEKATAKTFVPTLGLTKRGEAQARKLGRKIGRKGWKVKIYSTSVPRSRQTAQAMKEGADTPLKVRTRDDLFRFYQPNAPKAEMDELFSRGERHFMLRWIDGKVPPHLMHNPHSLAMHAVWAMRHIPRGIERLHGHPKIKLRIEAVAHDVTLAALFEELTQRRVPGGGKKSYADYLEAMRIDFTRDGKVILRYRKKRIDVTMRFFSLLKEAKKKMG